jgi:hypothetical protein
MANRAYALPVTYSQRWERGPRNKEQGTRNEERGTRKKEGGGGGRREEKRDRGTDIPLTPWHKEGPLVSNPFSHITSPAFFRPIK